MEQAVAALLVGTSLFCVVLVCLTLIRKVRRDRREMEFSERRARLERLLMLPEPGELEHKLRRIAHARRMQVDLVVVLDSLWPRMDESQRDRVHRAAKDSGLSAVLTHQIRSRIAVRRATAALLVGRLQLPGAFELLAPLVDDGDGDVRLVTVRSLATVADRNAAEVLIAALSAGQIEHERIIERLADTWAVPAIIDALASGSGDSEARASLARALGLAGDQSAEPVLRTMLYTGGVEERIGAARALGTAGSRASEPDLEIALIAPEWQVRAQAARSLGLLGVESAVPALGVCLGDQAWWVRYAAAEALAELGESGHAELRNALGSDDRYARQRAQEALTLHHLAGEA